MYRVFTDTFRQFMPLQILFPNSVCLQNPERFACSEPGPFSLNLPLSASPLLCFNESLATSAVPLVATATDLLQWDAQLWHMDLVHANVPIQYAI